MGAQDAVCGYGDDWTLQSEQCLRSASQRMPPTTLLGGINVIYAVLVA